MIKGVSFPTVLMYAVLNISTAQAQTCWGDPTDHPEFWSCATTIEPACGSVDQTTHPMAISTTIITEKGGTLLVIVDIAGLADYVHETQYWRTCIPSGLELVEIVQLPFSGVVLGPETWVEDLSNPSRVLVKATWPAKPPAFMGVLTFRLKVTAPPGTVIKLTSQSIRERIDYQGILQTKDRLVVAQPVVTATAR